MHIKDEQELRQLFENALDAGQPEIIVDETASFIEANIPNVNKRKLWMRVLMTAARDEQQAVALVGKIKDSPVVTNRIQDFLISPRTDEASRFRDEKYLPFLQAFLPLMESSNQVTFIEAMIEDGSPVKNIQFILNCRTKADHLRDIDLVMALLRKAKTISEYEDLAVNMMKQLGGCHIEDKASPLAIVILDTGSIKAAQAFVAMVKDGMKIVTDLANTAFGDTYSMELSDGRLQEWLIDLASDFDCKFGRNGHTPKLNQIFKEMRLGSFSDQQIEQVLRKALMSAAASNNPKAMNVSMDDVIILAGKEHIKSIATLLEFDHFPLPVTENGQKQVTLMVEILANEAYPLFQKLLHHLQSKQLPITIDGMDGDSIMHGILLCIQPEDVLERQLRFLMANGATFSPYGYNVVDAAKEKVHDDSQRGDLLIQRIDRVIRRVNLDQQVASPTTQTPGTSL